METNTFAFLSENNVAYNATKITNTKWEITLLNPNNDESWGAFKKAATAAFFAELGKEIRISYDEIADVFTVTIKD